MTRGFLKSCASALSRMQSNPFRKIRNAGPVSDLSLAARRRELTVLSQSVETKRRDSAKKKSVRFESPDFNPDKPERKQDGLRRMQQTGLVLKTTRVLLVNQKQARLAHWLSGRGCWRTFFLTIIFQRTAGLSDDFQICAFQ